MIPSGLVLDQVMPRWRSREKHDIAMPFARVDVMRCVYDLTWQEVPTFRTLLTAAGLGTRSFSADGRVLALFTNGPYDVLHWSATELVVAGILSTPGNAPSSALVGEEIRTYRELDRTGMIKVATNFHLAEGRLVTETRNLPIGWPEWALFRGYWTAIRAGSGAIRRSWLAGIRRRAAFLDSVG